MLSFLFAYFTSMTCGTPTSWVEVRNGSYVGQCGDEDGNVICHPAWDHKGCNGKTFEEQHAQFDAFNDRAILRMHLKHTWQVLTDK